MIVIDMDNPTDCDFCPFAFCSFYDTELLECNAKEQRYFTIKERTEDGKPDWCPIVGEIKVEGPVVIATKDGCCQYDDITETISPFEPYKDN